MKENLFEAQYDLTKKSKLKKFYESNKILIFSFGLILIILFSSFSLYLESREKKKILLSENYIQAKIYLEQGNKKKATNILREVIFENDPTYSTLCVFLIINQNLITDHNELSALFDHLLANNKFDEEVEHLLIYKKMLLEANYNNELEILKVAKPLLNSNTLWKAHALLFLGDYFSSKKQNIKAKEFYSQIFVIKNLHNDLYEQARLQLALIAND